MVSGASGLLLFLANPPVGLGPVAFVALIPFLWALRGCRPRRGVLLGFAFGFAYLVSTLYWILLFGTLAWGALSLASSAYVGLFGLLVPVLWREEHPVRSSIGVAALWTGTEYLRSLWPLGGFTWGGIGYTQAGNGFLLPLASVTGVWGVAFVVIVVNALLLLALERAGTRRTAAAALVATSFGVTMVPALIPIPAPTGRSLDVAVVQGNAIEHPLPSAAQEQLVIARTHAGLHHTLAGHPPDLAIWPEDAVDIDPTRYEPFRSIVEGAVRAVGVPTLVGAITDGPGGRQYNETLLYDGRGSVVGRYAKVHLVPFGEYVPWRRELGWISAVRQVPRDLTPGTGLHLLHVDGLRFATVICFENSFPSLDRRMIGEGAQFLVVATNNASYGRTAASRQHLIMSRLRAVENGRWVVHAAISGITAFIDPTGRVFDPTALYRATVDRHVIRASTARTVYNRFGDYFPWACMVATAGLMLAPRARRRRLGAPGPLPARARTLVIVPTYNERDTVGEVVGRILTAAPQVDILVVDDGSPDGTAEVVRELARSEPRVRLLDRGRKGGLAGAYVTGFRRALDEGYDLVVEMDADLSHQPEELPRLLDGARLAHLAVGSRYVRGGSVTNWGLVRRALSRAGNLYARWTLGFPLSDATSGFRVFRVKLLEHLVAQGVYAEGYAFQIELAYRAWRDGFTVREVPIIFRERERGHSKMSRRIVLEALWQVARWGVRDRLRAPPGSPSSGEPPRPTEAASGPPTRPPVRPGVNRR
ncbi:MAG TPA: apolipoprotein N-acyltransferase [Acidimicrobiales bacterium]|nr:apolipoprotein N-acyltransferase [Acidimicrobiales bacterium]